MKSNDFFDDLCLDHYSLFSGQDPGCDHETDPDLLYPGLDHYSLFSDPDPGSDPGFDPGYDPDFYPGYDLGSDHNFDRETCKSKNKWIFEQMQIILSL